MKKKFIGPGNPGPGGEDLGHDVTVRGRHLGNVRPGEVLDIPDELCRGTDDDPAPLWSPELWEDVKPTTAASKKSEGEV